MGDSPYRTAPPADEDRPEVDAAAVERVSARFDSADPKWHRLLAELKRRYPTVAP